MGKTKKKSAQNPNAVANQSIDEIKSGSKNLQNITDAKNNQNLLQNNKKELKEQYSLKRKNVSNKSQKKSTTQQANKKMKKELEVDESLNYYKEEEVNGDVSDGKMVKDILLPNSSKKNDKDFEGDKDENGEDELNCKKSDEERKELNMHKAKRILEKVNKEEYLLPCPNKRGEINRTTIKIENFPKEITELEIKEKFEEFGPIKSIQFKLVMPGRYFDFDDIKLKHPCYTLPVHVTVFIDYHCPLSAEKALSMNGKIYEGNYIIVSYKNNMNGPSIDSGKTVVLTNLPKRINEGIGTIYFATKDAASKAAELSGTLIFNRQITVELGYPAGALEQLTIYRTQAVNHFLTSYKTVQNILDDKKWRKKAQKAQKARQNLQ
ncbi:repetitive organellar protein [Linepithema humile]|uniref:repetitive organellar protein n=1 Tax=Linepithema humile TaxID=83485 RepID=UPI00351EF555